MVGGREIDYDSGKREERVGEVQSEGGTCRGRRYRGCILVGEEDREGVTWLEKRIERV